MRFLFVVALLAMSTVARADEAPAPPPQEEEQPETPPEPEVLAAPPAAEPLRIAIECQGWGRTKACPAFLLGFVEHNALFLSSPRSSAQVVLYYDVNEVANADRVFLRFVGDVEGAPPVVEITVDLDTRGDDDTQRAQLEPAFTRGAALFVAALHPEAVQIALVPVDGGPIVKPHTTPWGFSASVGGYGSWLGGREDDDEETTVIGDYTSASLYGGVSVSRLERTSILSFGVNGNYNLNRQPRLRFADGTTLSFDSKQWSLSAYTSAERHLDDHWALAAFSSLWRSDPKGQFKVGWDVNAGIEWDHYLADDPRGNQLFAAYLLGWQIDKYNLRNELDETFATYPTHGLHAGGTVRKDKIGYGLSVVAEGELIHPERRHTVSVSPFIELQVGAHVDLSLSVSFTERAVPGPDPDVIDTADPELVSRFSYAQPLSAYGSFNLRFHWDRTNGQRNDRFSNVGG